MKRIVLATGLVALSAGFALAADGTKGTCSARCAEAAAAQGTPVGSAPQGFHDPRSATAKAASPSRARGGKGN